MKIKMRAIQWNRIGLSNIYVMSMVLAMIFFAFFKREFLEKTSLFGYQMLSEIDSRLLESSPQYLFLVTTRVRVILFLFILSTTSIGNLYVYLCVIRYGICSGMFFTIVIMRYGLKGILLLVAGMFPHYLIYVPAFILTMHLAREKRKVNGRFLFQLFAIICVVIIGCLLECYVNPNVVSKILKKF